MSASGQKRTRRGQIVMSALPPKADIRPRDRDVCFGPIAEVSDLFDHFIRDGEHVFGSREEAELQARALINDWLKRHPTQKPNSS
jgi:hypothetical protein